MDRYETAEELRGIVGDYLKVQGVDLIDLILRRQGSDLILSILADKPQGGITLDECARLNRIISELLDEKGILQTRYILEVASPGLDRPLKEKGDFLRCLSRKARFFLNEPVNNKIELEGVIKRIEGDSVYIDRDNEIIEIPLVKINRAKQVIE